MIQNYLTFKTFSDQWLEYRRNKYQITNWVNESTIDILTDWEVIVGQVSCVRLRHSFAFVMHMQFPIGRPNRELSVPISSDIEIVLIGHKVGRLQVVVQVDLMWLASVQVDLSQLPVQVDHLPASSAPLVVIPKHSRLPRGPFVLKITESNHYFTYTFDIQKRQHKIEVDFT